MKTAFLVAAAVTAITAAPAAAQIVGPTLPSLPASTSTDLVFNLEAEVSSICGVYHNDAQSVNIDFGDLAATSADVTKTTTLTYTCNSPVGFTRTISSANGGELKRVNGTTGTGNAIEYRFRHLGGIGSDIGTRSSSLNSPVTSTHNQSSANYLNGVQADFSFIVPGVLRTYGGNANAAPRTTVFAGDYTDTVTLAITAR
jgi:spore coat protein U-like protein